MQFGRVAEAELDDLNWSLEKDHPQTIKVLPGSASEQFSLRLGCTGWSNKAWKGQIYPADARDKDFLGHYAQLFSAVELNSSHYRLPPDDWIKRWKDQVPSNFQFSPKLHQQISHRGSLCSNTALIDQFIGFLENLRPNLGLSFLQLPERYGPDQRNDLLQFLESWPNEYPISIEFRHPDWFLGSSEAEEVWASLETHKVKTVITDTAGRPDVRHMRLTHNSVMVRFVGNHPHQSDMSRIQSWVRRLGDWKSHGLKNAYFFLHQHDNLGIDVTTRAFAEEWNALQDQQLKYPGEQPPMGQMDLF